MEKQNNVFDLLEPRLKKLVKDRFERPTEIQRLVMPEILNMNNVLVISETGSGKTEACLLPVFNFLAKKEHKPIAILYITPLRSLNRDLLKRILWWANHLEFDVSVRHGDTSAYERSMQSENPPELLIVTPETLQAILIGKNLRKHLENIEFVIVDEVHELVDNKRGVQLSIGLERLKQILKKKPQIIGLSATVGSPENVAKFLTAGEDCKILNASKARNIKIKVESPEPTKEDYEASERIIAGPEITARLRRISELISEKRSVLTFTNTRESSEVLSSRLRVLNEGLPIETHHSSLSKEVRIKAEEEFKEEKLKSLICTSSLELGIDIGSIDFVLQYMSPRQVAKILQRIGRSGHDISRIPEGIIISADTDDCFESAIIAEHALRGLIEPTDIYSKALDVLGHQIIGLALEYYKIPLDKAYEIIKKAYPYRNLSKDEFFEVCDFLQKLRVLWTDSKYAEDGEVVLKRRKSSWTYYYNNLSTIPDVKNYKVIDIISNKTIGTLDAEFVALHGQIGTGFIVKGQAWRIIDIDRTKIIAEPMHGIEAAIPAWVGELIPVPFEVAQGVGKLRKEISERLESKDLIDYLMQKYPIDKSVAKKFVNEIKKQYEFDFVPTDKEVFIEYWTGEDGTYIIIHSCWGSLVNDTVGRVLSTLLINKLGSVGLQTDPYRIIIKIAGFGWEDVMNQLKELRPETIKKVLENTMDKTELFMWRFIHVAQRFSIISRDADYGKGYIRKLIESYAGTPAYKEAMNEIMQEKLDIEKACDVIREINNGKIQLSVKKGLSPLGRSGLERKYEIVAAARPDKEIFDIFRERILDKSFGLLCCNCGSWVAMGKIRDLTRILVCRRCAARLISPVPPRHAKDAELLLKKHKEKKKMTNEEKKWLDWMTKAAGLVLDHGFSAIIAMAGRGVGPRTAARILSKVKAKGGEYKTPEDNNELFNEILEAERQYHKTRRFWRD